MGEVWLVKDVELDVKRALKMITQGTAFNSDARARFRREARAMAQFSHRNVVTVHDSRLDMRDVAYIVMEYVAGQSLEKVLRPGRPMPLDWTFDVLTQLCEALQVAHRRGIIHRDLKPSNLILIADESGGETLKVLDFGIAKILQAEEAPQHQDVQTIAGSFMGTPPCATGPEQASGQAEPASDIYSVGVILFEALAGNRPFRGKPAELIAQTLFNPPPSFAEVNPHANVPPEIERIVLRCLAKNPEDRPQSPYALLEEFKAAMPRPGEVFVPEKVKPGPHPELPPPPAPGPSRRKWIIGGVIVAAALVLVLASVLLFRPTPSPGPVDPTPGPPEISKAPKPKIEWESRPFTLWKTVYLPEGYSPSDPDDLVEGHPRMIVREGVKFVWIKGGRYLMGAKGKVDDPETDCDPDNVPAHPVVVPGFYIQKFEVTNGELRDYDKERKAGPADTDSFDKWRDHFDEVSVAITPERAAKHPAREVTWKLASDFARKRGGWLPWGPVGIRRPIGRDGPGPRLGRGKGPEQRHRSPGEPGPIAQGQQYLDVRGDRLPGENRTDQGVMGMAGNVREWCRDRWLPYPEIVSGKSTALPDDPTDDPEIVARGGSFNLNGSYRANTSPAGASGFACRTAPRATSRLPARHRMPGRFGRPVRPVDGRLRTSPRAPSTDRLRPDGRRCLETSR